MVLQLHQHMDTPLLLHHPPPPLHPHSSRMSSNCMAITCAFVVTNEARESSRRRRRYNYNVCNRTGNHSHTFSSIQKQTRMPSLRGRLNSNLAIATAIVAWRFRSPAPLHCSPNALYFSDCAFETVSTRVTLAAHCAPHCRARNNSTMT